MIESVRSVVAAVVANPKVRSVARHAASAAVGVLVAAVAVGGFPAVTVAVVAGAAGAAARVVLMAVEAALVDPSA